MNDPEEMIDVFRAIRHDWLNDLQLIKANLELNRVERVSEVVEMLVSRARNEARLSNLCAPKTVAYLLTYNLYRPAVSLKYEVVGKMLDLSTEDDYLYAYICNVLTYFNDKVERQVDNQVTIRMDLTEKQVVFTLDFVGQLVNVEEADRFFIEQAAEHYMHYTTKYIHKEKAILAFIITT